MEALYYQGKIVIHQRKGAVRYFSLPSKLFGEDIITDYHFPDDFEYLKFRVLRRIKGVGLLSYRSSYAYIAIHGLNTSIRRKIMDFLEAEGKIIKVNIEGFSYPYYLAKEDERHLYKALNEKDLKSRLEFLAPLDNLLWDRDFIKELFGFDYTWEIYFTKEKRQYGYYVLPILYGLDFIGRIDLNANRKENTLEVKKIFLEPNVILSPEIRALITDRINKFASFNEVENVKYFDHALDNPQ